MTYIKNVQIGAFAIAFALFASIFSQLYINRQTHAANTLSGNNEIITIGGTTDGQPLNAPATPSAYSADGNVILFSSSATNLPNASASTGLYIYNISANTTARVDMSTNGTAANAAPWGIPKISETGRYVIFASNGTNLIDGTTTPIAQYYKRDTQTGVTTYIGNHYSGGLSQNWDRNLGVSNDGRFILMASRYWANAYPNNYGTVIGEDVNGTYNWTSIAKDNGGGQGSGNSTAIMGGLSCDGAFAAVQKDRYIVFADLRKGSITTIDVATSNSVAPLISCNGRYVLYATSNRTDITPTPSGMNANFHLARYDRITGKRQYVGSNSSGAFGTGITFSFMNEPPSNPFNASIADTGDVVFNYTGNVTHLKHLSDGSGTLESIAKTTSGSYVNVSSGIITADGRYIFFRTDPYDLGLAPSPSSIQIIRAKTNL